jgi:hypothetical protein
MVLSVDIGWGEDYYINILQEISAREGKSQRKETY